MSTSIKEDPIEEVEEEEADGKSPQKRPHCTLQPDGSSQFVLSSHRRISVRKFKGKSLIDIREYYEAGGEFRPGKKGISLSVEQYKLFKEMIPYIDEALHSLK